MHYLSWIAAHIAQAIQLVARSVQRMWSRVALAFAVVAAGVFLSPTVAFAASAENGDLIVPFNLDWIALLRLLVIPVLLPSLVGVINRVTPGDWPAFTKRLLLAGTALAQSIGIEFLAAYDRQTPYDIWGALFTGVIAYAVAELTYQGFYKAPLTSGGETVVTEIVPIEPLPASTTKAAAIEAYNNLAGSAAAVTSTGVSAPTIASKLAG